jgi:DNA-binding CsgD family transcriptional regulator
VISEQMWGSKGVGVPSGKVSAEAACMGLRHGSPSKISRPVVFEARDLLEFLLHAVPTGIIVVDDTSGVAYLNAEGRRCLERYDLPEEVLRISRRMLEAFHSGILQELFPGEVYIEKNLPKSTGKRLFKLRLFDGAAPHIAIFISEEATSNNLSMNEIRIKYRLTRRETDVLRRVLRGLKNGHIAEELGITLQTVKGHLTSIYGKIGITNRNELMRLFVRPGP